MDVLDLLQTHASTETILLASAVLSCLLLLRFLVSYSDGRALGTRKRPDLDTPRGVFLLGNLPTLIKNGEKPLEYWADLRAKQKDKTKALSLTVPGFRLIDVTKPSYLKHIQSTNFANYGKGAVAINCFLDVFGEGIFAVDGEKWKVQRQATARIFTANNFRGCITNSIERDLKTLVTILGRYADSGDEFDLSALFFRFTLSSFCRMAFGQDIGALSLESDAPVPFAVAFDYTQTQLPARLNNPLLFSYVERLNGTAKKMREAIKVIDDFAYNLIQQRENEGLSADKKDTSSTDLLSLYLAIRDEKGQPLSKKALRDAVLNLIIAGRDTTAQTLSWTCFHLLANPQLIDPLRAEYEEKGVVDYDSYKTMTRTLAVLNEGIRLHPSVPKAGWIALGDDQLPDGGPMIKAGDRVRWSDWELGRSQEVWGPDAVTFKPSRWIDADGHLKTETQWKMHAFNGGPRLCLGKNLATYEATAVLSAILRDFDVSFAPNYLETTEMMDAESAPRYLASLTFPMKDPLLVKVTRRGQA